jgi:tryptophanase
LLDELGVPTIKPAGGHAVYIDAKEYLKQIPETEFRSDTLAMLIYALSGIRSVAIGNLMYADKDAKGRILKPAKNDFVRLAVPRNVYSLEHVLYVANCFEKIHAAKSKLTRGLQVGEGFRNDHFDHFDCKMTLLDEANFKNAVLG